MNGAIRSSDELDARKIVRRMRLIALCFLSFIALINGVMTVHFVQSGLKGLMPAIVKNVSHMLLWFGFATTMFLSPHALDVHRRFCSKCRYERATGPDGEEQTGSTCPECGSEWNAPKATTRGTIRWRPTVIALGVLLALAPITATFFGINWDTYALRLTPTDLLIRETVERRGFNVSEWVELNSRTLSQEQKIALTLALLEKRRELGGLIMDDATWLTNSVSQDWFPDEIRLRILEDPPGQ